METTNLVIKVYGEDKMISLGEIITKYTRPNLVIALTGDLGAGKTTFTKGIGKALGIKRVINSPTFTIMKIYNAENKKNGIDKLYHLDVYRLSSSGSDFELEEYFYLDGLTIIEWADIIYDLLPSDLWKMNIERDSLDARKVTFTFDSKTDITDLINELKENDYEIIY